jgi:hypothetical protein
LDAGVADICRTRAIAAEPQAIWDVLADFGTISTWADNVDHSCLLGPAAQGVTVGTTRRVQTGRNTLVERITDFDPPNTLAYDIQGLPSQLRTVSNRWRLRPAANGSSEVTLTSTVEIGPRPFQQLAERVVSRLLAKQSDVMLAGLANRLESSRA